MATPQIRLKLKLSWYDGLVEFTKVALSCFELSWVGLSGVELGSGFFMIDIKSLLLIIRVKINSSLGFDNKDYQTNKHTKN